MILQPSIEEPTGAEILFGIIALITTFIMIAVVLGIFFYFFSYVYRFKERTEGSERLFWLRSFIIALIAVLVIYGVEFIFSLLLFSPLFYQDIPVNLMNSVTSTDIRGIIAALATTPTQVIILFVIMIVLIVAILSYLMLGIYKVSYGWTTLLTWSAIGIFLLIDITVSFTINEDGLAGIISLIPDLIRGLATS